MNRKVAYLLCMGASGALLLEGCQAWQTASGVAPTTPQAVHKTPVEATPSAPPVTPAYTQFELYSHVVARHNHFIPSGYMGDSNLTLSGAYVTPHEGTGPCLRIYYRSGGQMGWTGIYWQQPANNWGDIPGNAGYDLRGATRLVFWARGEKGGEKVHEFRVGGIVGRYPDSDVVSLGPIVLSKDWKHYEIDLKGKDLRHIIGGFGFFLNKFDDPDGAVFYLDDIAYEIPRNAPSPRTPSPIVASAPPSKTTAAVEAPEPPEAPALVGTPEPSQEIHVKAEEAGLRVSFSSQFLFASGQTTLLPESQTLLGQIVNTLKAYPKNDVLVEGHTDKSGDAAYNLQLSTLRAENVRDYLIKEGGFDAKRFRVVGYGDTRPIADNSTAGGRTLNRRVELIILKASEKP